MYIEILITGFGGGAMRGLIGFVKHQYSYKNVGFDLLYFLNMMFISGIIGLLTAVAVKETGIDLFGTSGFTPAFGFIIGYAGGDVIENIYKIVKKK
ncbi:MAG: hypothetical protein U9Q27_02570 [Patescibacteria group bacterium]|nr:hypothetical protein [Patescibacteria group bacterium]